MAPSSSWDETTVFYNDLNKSDQQSYRDIAKRIFVERNKWEWKLRKEELMDDDDIIEYEDANPMKFSVLLADDIQKYIKSKIKWLKKGEYYLVEFITHNGDITTAYYNFSVTDSTIEALDEISMRHNYFIDQFSDTPKGIFENLASFKPSREIKKKILNMVNLKS